MTFSQKMAANVAPLLLRFGLAVVFIWAGYGKLFYEQEFSAEQGAVLAELGVATTPVAPEAQDEPEEPEEGEGPAPDAESNVRAAPAPGRVLNARAQEDNGAQTDEQPATPEEGAEDLARQATREQEAPDQAPGGAEAAPGEAQEQAPEVTGPVRAQRVYYLAYLLKVNSDPALGNGTQLWPSFLAGNLVIKVLAWAAVLTELVGGAFLLLGLLTRLSALGIAGTMVGAMALTSIGPAIVGDQSFLGFLPALNYGSPGWVGAWQPWLFQFVLLLMALSLLLTGAGAVSIDRRLFGARKRDTRDSSGEELED